MTSDDLPHQAREMLKKYDLRSSSAEEGLDQAEFAMLLMECEFAPVELQQCWKKCIDGWRSSCESYLPTKLYELLNKVWGKAAPLHARALACARPRRSTAPMISEGRSPLSLDGRPLRGALSPPAQFSVSSHTHRPILGFVTHTPPNSRFRQLDQHLHKASDELSRRQASSALGTTLVGLGSPSSPGLFTR
jgi:hypothetical protein